MCVCVCICIYIYIKGMGERRLQQIRTILGSVRKRCGVGASAVILGDANVRNAEIKPIVALGTEIYLLTLTLTLTLTCG